MKIIKGTLGAFAALMLAALMLGVVVIAVAVGVVVGGAWLGRRAVLTYRGEPEVIEVVETTTAEP